MICSVDLERATKVRHYQNVVSRPRTYNKSRIDLTANARINQADTMMRSFEKQSVNPESDHETAPNYCTEEEVFDSQLQLTLNDLFPNGLTDFDGKWKPWKN